MKGNVAIVYHFFPHYRKAINNLLLNSDNFKYYFYGDDHDPLDSGIKAWTCPDSNRFVCTRCRFIKKRYLIQSDVIGLALRSDFDHIIYLGDAQFLTTWISIFLARLTGKKVYFWSHGWWNRSNDVKEKLRTIFYGLAHRLLVYGNRSKAIGVSLGFAPEKIHVIYNSLDYALQKIERYKISPESICQTRKDLFGNADIPVVICTTRLVKMRRLDLLLESLSQLKAKGINTNLLLVGDGPERQNLEILSHRLNLQVFFYGECYSEEILSKLISCANITVAPGKVGLSVTHSLAYGVPVISHSDPNDQGPEWEAIEEGVTGGLFIKNNINDLARAIEQYVVSPMVPEIVRKKCYEVIDRFYNPDYQMKVIESALEDYDADDTNWKKWIDI